MRKRFTTRQQKFVDIYEGNGTEAARLAGFAGTDAVLANVARNLLIKTDISEAIRSRQDKAKREFVANREQRQAFWTKTMQDITATLRDRLKASELLGRSEGDFLDRIAHTVTVTLEQLVLGSISGNE